MPFLPKNSRLPTVGEESQRLAPQRRMSCHALILADILENIEIISRHDIYRH